MHLVLRFIRVWEIILTQSATSWVMVCDYTYVKTASNSCVTLMKRLITLPTVALSYIIRYTAHISYITK